MNKTSQIQHVSEAIQELCDLLGTINTNENYTKVQAISYYNEIFKRNQLKLGEDPEHIKKPEYINHVCMMAKELAKLMTFMNREEVSDDDIKKRINIVAEMLKIDEE